MKRHPKYFAGRVLVGLTLLCFWVGAGLLCWGEAPFLAVQSTPHRLPIYSVETPDQAPRISLGINCAWGNGDLSSILETLKQAEVKATFFLVGDFCEAYPESVQEIYEQGHELGNHSDTHADLPSLSADAIKQELEACSDKIEAITGTRPTLFRPPSGSYNDTVMSVAESLGYVGVQWDVDSLDWKGLTEKEMLDRMLPKVRYGSILLMHSDTAHTAEALPAILQTLQEKGFAFVPVGELILSGETGIDHTGRQYPLS